MDIPAWPGIVETLVPRTKPTMNGQSVPCLFPGLRGLDKTPGEEAKFIPRASPSESYHPSSTAAYFSFQRTPSAAILQLYPPGSLETQAFEH